MLFGRRPASPQLSKEGAGGQRAEAVAVRGPSCRDRHLGHLPEGGGAPVVERAVLAAPGQLVELLPGWVPLAS